MGMHALALPVRRPARCWTGTTTTATIPTSASASMLQFAEAFFSRRRHGLSGDHRGTVGKENTFGTCVGRVKAGAMSFARFSTDDFTGRIRGYVGEGEFTKDPLETFGGAGVAYIPKLQKLLRYICEQGFEHHVAANFSQTRARSMSCRPLPGMDMYYHNQPEA